MAGLSGTLKVVPSIAHTNMPRHRTAPVGGPASNSNSARNGATPTRRRAWASTDDDGTHPGPSRPDTSRDHTCPSP
ncbi:hypothetical protein [Actinomadura harenae]|uniref:hypothetical protein n=1 Tax=Actinomadura harenae TaxID=2483351 RepID=UPI0018F3E2ED|nr:hypothetical protein [Actinomadura harenae]